MWLKQSKSSMKLLFYLGCLLFSCPSCLCCLSAYQTRESLLLLLLWLVFLSCCCWCCCCSRVCNFRYFFCLFLGVFFVALGCSLAQWSGCTSCMHNFTGSPTKGNNVSDSSEKKSKWSAVLVSLLSLIATVISSNCPLAAMHIQLLLWLFVLVLLLRVIVLAASYNLLLTVKDAFVFCCWSRGSCKGCFVPAAYAFKSLPITCEHVTNKENKWLTLCACMCTTAEGTASADLISFCSSCVRALPSIINSGVLKNNK